MSISTVQQAPSLPSEKYSRTELPSKRSGSILVVDDEAGIRNFLHRALIKEYGLVEVAESVETAEELRQRCHFDLLIVDIRLSDRSGLEWVEELRRRGNSVDVIFITAYADLTTTISALRSGATDFILKPFRLEQILASVERSFERRISLPAQLAGGMQLPRGIAVLLPRIKAEYLERRWSIFLFRDDSLDAGPSRPQRKSFPNRQLLEVHRLLEKFTPGRQRHLNKGGCGE